MRSEKERIQSLHRRCRNLKRQKDKNALTLYGGSAVGLCILLAACVMYFSGPSQTAAGDLFTAASMLSENTGGYVLVAVIAFFIGVVLTAVIRYFLKEKENKNNSRAERGKEAEKLKK